MMEFYGDLESLSKAKQQLSYKYYRMCGELDMELSATITYDGILYHVKYKNKSYTIEDAIFYEICENTMFCREERKKMLTVYIGVLSKEITYSNIEEFYRLKHWYWSGYKELFEITDSEIRCRTYKEWIEYNHKNGGHKVLKTYSMSEDVSKCEYKFDGLCIYRFLDKDNNIIYVGKTVDLVNRMTTHFSGGHLDESCYEQVNKIEYIKCENQADMNIKEIYFINKYKPKFNTKDLYKGEVYNSDYDSIVWDNEYPIPIKNN